MSRQGFTFVEANNSGTFDGNLEEPGPLTEANGIEGTPGTYDVWCESCCGGKDAPQMHGKIVVEPASAADVTGQALG